MADKKWIQWMKIHKWSLRSALGIKEWETIPTWLLNELSKSKVWSTVRWHKVTTELKQKITLAKNFAKMKK